MAVLVVLFFHLGFHSFSGGFVGVDIFFVISGFVITRLITFSIARERFSFGAFYRARIRRLFPALLATVAFTTAASFFVLSPEHYALEGMSAAASVVSLSNWLFWSQSGYFDTDKMVKPLLHTWSLSVEEQFYLAWPLMLWVSLRIRRPLIGLALIGGGSLFLAEYWDHRTSAFYLPFFRVCEFALGASLVWFERTKPTFWDEAAYILGAIVMGYGIFTYDRDTYFPGLSAMVICAGAALSINSGHAKYAAAVLRSWPAQHIGRISYSLYLAHWPIIVLFSYWNFTSLSVTQKVCLGVFCYASSLLLHFGIEERFRRSKNDGSLGFVFVGAVSAAVLGIAIFFADGLPGRLAPPAEEVNSALAEFKAMGYASTAVVSADVLLIGDSHADHFGPAIIFAAARAGRRQSQLNLAGCPPLFDLGIEPKTEGERACAHAQIRWKAAALTFKGSIVVLAARWEFLSETPDAYRPHWLQIGHEHFANALKRTVDEISKSGKKVVLLGQVPPTRRDLSRCFSIPPYLILHKEARCLLPTRQWIASRIAASDRILSSLASERVFVWLPSDWMCDDQRCRTQEAGMFLYRNEDHITPMASIYIGATRMGQLTEFLRRD